MSTLKVDGIRSNSASSDAITLASDGTCTANITNNLSNRNLIINGSHIVWQRTTSISGGSTLDNFAYATDRFWLYSPSSSSGTVGQSTDAPSGFIYSTHNNLNAACTIGTNVELLKVGSDAPFVNGESLTLSFYIKSTSARSNVGISISTRDNAGGTNSVTRASGVTFNSTTSWTRVEKTFTLSGTVGGSNACLQFEISLAIGDKVTGFQLEKNSFATDFEHRSFAQELALCQRYYETSYDFIGGTYPGAANTSHYFMTTPDGYSFQPGIDFKVVKRAAPTVVMYSTTGAINKFRKWTTGDDQTATAGHISANGFLPHVSSSTSNVFYAGQFTADAEL